MRVIATRQGFDGTVVRNPGDEFEAPLGPPDEKTGKRTPIVEASWYKLVKESKPDLKSDKSKDDLV